MFKFDIEDGVMSVMIDKDIDNNRIVQKLFCFLQNATILMQPFLL